jgi:hypothetical protein
MADNSKKIILDLCGGTGAWSKPYADSGYDVRVITLPEYDVCDYEVPENVHGILAAPPCTEFSLAKGNGHRDFHKAMKIVKACLEAVWIARCDGELKWWCLENPTGILRQFLGVPKYTFEQWMFGELLVKKTDLWGYFTMPKQVIKQKPELLMMIRYPNGKTNSRCWSKPDCPMEYEEMKLSRQDKRAITPPGFSRAFFEVNQ